MFNISNVLDYIKTLFTSYKVPQQSVPKELIVTGTLNRSGMSYRQLAADIIAAQEQAGIPQGILRNGEQNVVEKMIAITAQKTIEHLVTNLTVEIVIPPSSIQVQGLTAAGVVFNGVNINIVKGRGIVK